jgi:ABC-type amino acid transport substrate-binding protein
VIAARLSTLLFLALVSIALTGVPPARADGTLRVCLDENIPPLSSKRGKEAHGFDLAVAQAIAQRLE